MVRFNDGKQLNWQEIKENLPYFRKRVRKEFLYIYDKYKDIDNYPFKWGDEIEFSLFRFDHENKKVHILLKAKEFFEYINDDVNKQEINDLVEYHKEYADYIIESIPGMPFDDSLEAFVKLEESIKLRREFIQNFLGKNEYVLSLTCFPLIGCKNFTWPEYKANPKNGINDSLFFPSEAILDDENFKFGTRNINQRRKNKPIINVPIFIDKNTPRPFIEDLSNYDITEEEKTNYIKPDMIYMDAKGFGMGCCCIQVTFQAKSLNQAKILYDQLTPITPIVLALSAASPVWRGYLAQIDCRWNVIKEAMDDRTKEELGEEPLENDKYRLFRARYDTNEIYLSDEGKNYNDVDVPFDQCAFDEFVQNGVDELIAKHYSNIFIRDPLMLPSKNLDNKDNEEINSSENLELIQNLHWRMLRFKVPPVKSEANNNIGWRIEFRPTELQLTNFENTAFATFIILLTRALAASPEINLLVPLTNVDTNMQRAVKYNAYLDEKFYFRKNIVNSTQQDEAVVEEMSINEIINGNGSDFKGLLSIIKEYLDKHHKSADAETRARINNYLKLIELRASGKLLTSASWIRNYIDKHPKYNHDSVVSDEIAYDLLWAINQIQTDQLEAVDLIPNELKNFNYLHIVE